MSSDRVFRTRMGRTKSVAKKRPHVAPSPKFENEQAEERYNEVVQHRKLCAEKGFLLQDDGLLGYPDFVQEVIKRNGWQKLCSHPMVAYVPVVKEFYSHLVDGQQDTVYVRGVNVRVESSLINQWYGLPDEEDEHSRFVDSMTEDGFNDVVRDICIPGTRCSKSAQGALTIMRNNLTTAAKVWFHFLRFSLMPTGHLHTLSMPRVLLLHSILKGRKVNMGKVILSEIVECAERQKGPLYFPCFISSLCAWAGVAVAENEEVLANTGAITKIAIQRVSQDSVAAADVYEMSPEDAAGPSSTPQTASPSSTPQPEMNQQLNERLSAIEATQQTILEELQQMQQDQRTYWSYMQRWNRGLQHNLQANSTRFHSFPLFPDDILHPPEDRGNMED